MYLVVIIPLFRNTIKFNFYNILSRSAEPVTWTSQAAQDFAMSEDSLNLVLQKQSNKTSSGITKIQIKSEKHTSFGGIFPIMEKFDRMLSHTTQVMMHT